MVQRAVSPAVRQPQNVVLVRRGDAIRFHPTQLSFAGHYRYEPRPVAVARGNEKGREERAIRYIRSSFFPARTYRDLDELNEQEQGNLLALPSDTWLSTPSAWAMDSTFRFETPW